MTRWLQTFSFKKSFYERPNQKWICGRSSLGEPCLIGPDKNGKCRATYECWPLKKKWGQWACTRPPDSGGTCKEGPSAEGICGRPIPKCQPVRSLRAWRGLVVLWTVAFSIGLLCFLAATRSGRVFLSPGEMSLAHSASKSQCADCHPGAEGAPLSWFRPPVSAAHERKSSGLCLQCHNIGAHPLAVHGSPSIELVEHTKRMSLHQGLRKPLTLRLSSMIVGPQTKQGELACSTCHIEHRGKGHDLKRLGDLQCQSCHAVQFASFAAGHPSFSSHPASRRTRIIFDHAAHFKNHFREDTFKSVAPVSCVHCHQPDSKERAMLLKPFLQSCAACHADQIRGEGRAGAKGIPIINLPGLDVKTLQSHGIGIGEWPENAEGKISPFLELFFSGDPGLRGELEKISNRDLLDLAGADEATLKAVSGLAWAVKTLLWDLQTKGQTGLVNRLEAALDRRLPKNEIEDLMGLLSMDVVLSANALWFPRLADELDQLRGDSKRAASSPSKAASRADATAGKPPKPEDWVAAGGWYRSDDDCALFYRPSGHADKFLTSWLDLTAAADPGQPKAAEKVFKQLSRAEAPGRCTKCHSVDRDPRLRINWRSFQPDPSEHPFTQFSHGPHLSLGGRASCVTCHNLNEKADGPSASKDNQSPAVFQRNFKAVEQQLCASCHNARSAGDRCLLCHNYHIGTFAPTGSAMERFPIHAPTGP